jgi:hypothetical protein
VYGKSKLFFDELTNTSRKCSHEAVKWANDDIYGVFLENLLHSSGACSALAVIEMHLVLSFREDQVVRFYQLVLVWSICSKAWNEKSRIECEIVTV